MSCVSLNKNPGGFPSGLNFSGGEELAFLVFFYRAPAGFL